MLNTPQKSGFNSGYIVDLHISSPMEWMLYGMTMDDPWPTLARHLRKLKDEHAKLDDKAEVVLSEYNKLQPGAFRTGW